MLKTLLLFIATALAEIVGCYLPWLWLKQGKPAWLLLPAAASLALFAWLLTLHDTTGAGRVYAAYGGVYIGVALVWLWAVDGIRPRRGMWRGCWWRWPAWQSSCCNLRADADLRRGPGADQHLRKRLSSP